MDLSTGYLLLEEVAEDRTYATWKILLEERLKGLGTGVLYLVSDRAKALNQLAEQGLECLSMPDFFHVVHDIIKSYSLALGRHRRHAHQALKHAQEALARCQEQPHAGQDAPEAMMVVAARLTTTAVQGVDGIAQLRRSRGGWYDTSLALFQATVPGPLRNRVIAYRGPASTTETKTPSRPMPLKSLGVPPCVDTVAGGSCHTCSSVSSHWAKRSWSCGRKVLHGLLARTSSNEITSAALMGDASYSRMKWCSPADYKGSL